MVPQAHKWLVPVSMKRWGQTFCHTMKKEEAHLCPASICLLDGERRPAPAAMPIQRAQLFFPLLNKTHPLCQVSLHGALCMGSPLLCRGHQKSHPKGSAFGATKPPPVQAQPHRQRASGSAVSRLQPRVASIITQGLFRFTPAKDFTHSPNPGRGQGSGDRVSCACELLGFPGAETLV